MYRCHTTVIMAMTGNECLGMGAKHNFVLKIRHVKCMYVKNNFV